MYSRRDMSTQEEIQPQSEMPSGKGLTKEFRDSELYIKYKKDILARGIDEMWVDQIIFWYVSRPDMFTCEAGKKMMAEFDARVSSQKTSDDVEEQAKSFAAKFSKLVVVQEEEDEEEDAEADAASITTLCGDGHHGDGGCDSICELPRVDTSGPESAAPGSVSAAAAAAGTSCVSASPTSTTTAQDKDDISGFPLPDERDQ
jgi:hypothetical protein